MKPISLALLPLAILAACSSPEDRAAKARLLSGETRPAPAAFDWARPQAALRIGAEEAATRLGSFEWTAVVSWSVAKTSEPSARVQASEHHRVRQLSSGDFEVESEVDPGRGPGSESGKHVIYVDKMTYARSLYAPFGAFRERPSDRGRDARRYRDESFGIGADLADLFGGRLELQHTGDGTLLSRPVKRFAFSVSAPPAEGAGRRSPPSEEAPSSDEDTQRRLAFLNGRIPVRASGECLLDAETGVPLKMALRGVFEVKGHPEARAEVDLTGQMRTLGSATLPVARPRGALPDERKPRGVARALEAAGLKKRGGAEMGREEPQEESE